MRLILASTNQHKLKEIRHLFEHSSFELLSLRDFDHIPEPPEPFHTFRENAAHKAHFVYKYTKGVVIADDSGLEVDALGGAPGVHSKRYTLQATAEANNAKLLAELENVTNRRAQFRCVLAIFDGQRTEYVEGVCTGNIALHLSGQDGFGYDPLFVPDAFAPNSMAEMSMSEKNIVSHRGLAFRQLPAVLKQMGLMSD